MTIRGLLIIIVLATLATLGILYVANDLASKVSPGPAVVDCHGPHDCGYGDNGTNGDH